MEHTVTEEVTCVDLVTAQLRLADGATLADPGLDAAPTPRGVAVQGRVNAETVTADGDVRPGAGTFTRFAPPPGRGIRVGPAARAGTVVDPRFDRWSCARASAPGS